MDNKFLQVGWSLNLFTSQIDAFPHKPDFDQSCTGAVIMGMWLLCNTLYTPVKTFICSHCYLETSPFVFVPFYANISA